MGDDPSCIGSTNWVKLIFVCVTVLILSVQEVSKAGLHLLFNWHILNPTLFIFPAHKYNLPQILNRVTHGLLQFAYPELHFLCYSQINSSFWACVSLPFYLGQQYVYAERKREREWRKGGTWKNVDFSQWSLAYHIDVKI